VKSQLKIVSLTRSSTETPRDSSCHWIFR